MPTLKIALVDDHPIVRAGFKQLLEMEPEWEVTGEIGSASELAAWLRTGVCDVMVLDLTLPDGDGLILIRQLQMQRPGLKTVVMSMHNGALYVRDAMAAGARGYVTKSSGPDELVEALYTVARGEIYVGRDVRAHVVDGESGWFPELTGREGQVLLLLARGHSVARVAATIGISDKTAYAHRSSIYAKLGVQSDFQLFKLATQRGFRAA